MLCAENLQPDTSVERWDLYKVLSPKGYVLMSELISLLMVWVFLSTEKVHNKSGFIHLHAFFPTLSVDDIA